MADRVRGKVAFVSGLARGQGRSHAMRLAEEGADIIGIDLCEDIPENPPYHGSTEEDLAETVRLIEGLDRRIVVQKGDVRDYDAVKSAVDAGVAEFGRLDIVAANAGIGSKPFTIDQITAAQWDEMIGINLTGVFHACKASIPHIVAGGNGGAMILTASVTAVRGYANYGHYNAAKHGVLGLMRTLANELGAESIRVNSILPTQVATDMALNPTIFKLFCPDVENPTQDDFAPISQAMHTLPIPWVQPRDISNALLFLASDEARYITGVALPVDAGCLVK
ncbi:MAG TPA: mycofactocin-coupled SDR family oxidoreductase [Solirubrobacteraceae bacterium]